MMTKLKNEYDETKELLRTIRKLNTLTPQAIREQLNPEKKLMGDDETAAWDPSDKEGETQSMKGSIENYWKDNPQPSTTNQGTEKKDYNVINNVEVVINSSDNADLILTDEEKGKLSQLIDDFRSEVSEIAEFGKLIIYNNNAKLDGNISEINLSFTLSAGDNNGLFLNNTSMLQINDKSTQYIEKLKKFQIKFNDVLGDIISYRQQN